MTALRTAAQQALEALGLAKLNGKAGLYPAEIDEIADAITALRAALAEPVQEPVAWSHINGTSDTKWHPPQRKPLTEEEIYSLFRTVASPVMFARAIERAHDIT